MRQFPPELIDAVIRENHDDIPTLRSSALVWRAFLPSSQACIFSVVELVAFKQTALRLHKTLVQSPHLCRHVKTLRITRLALFHRSNWDTLPEGLRVSLCEFCRRSHLRSLELLHLGELADLSQFAQLVTSPLLTRISFLGLSLELPLPHPTMPHPSPQLNRCQLYLRPPTLDTVARWLIGGGAFANIRELGFLWDDDTVPQVDQLLQASKNTLRILYLKSTHSVFPPLGILHTLSLAGFAQLRVVSISYLILTEP
ncbi:hypothetical protein C8R46DRAFT_1234796 [Mycena filopes]|nr:hypothetical protein C8R46DRAFT_1234796 [Mycena filopes]